MAGEASDAEVGPSGTSAKKRQGETRLILFSMSLKFGNNVETQPENSVSVSGIKCLQVGQIKLHFGTCYQSLWALILSCSQLSAGLASLLLVLWGVGPFPNPDEKGKTAVSVHGTSQCLASAASRTQFPASALSKHQCWAWSFNCKNRTWAKMPQVLTYQKWHPLDNSGMWQKPHTAFLYHKK